MLLSCYFQVGVLVSVLFTLGFWKKIFCIIFVVLCGWLCLGVGCSGMCGGWGVFYWAVWVLYVCVLGFVVRVMGGVFYVGAGGILRVLGSSPGY